MKEDPKSSKQAKSAAPTHGDSEHQGGKTMSPPAFQLKASSAVEPEIASVSGRPNLAGGATAQRKEPTPYRVDKNVPELQYGAAQSGPIAEKGAGDAHAFAANDVNQGALGDCWLLSSLMAIANTTPDVLKNAITGPKSDGSYDVKLYKKHSGLFTKTHYEAETVNVTSSFVTYKAGGGNAYASGGDTDASGKEELWVKLIEKAYAKWKGSYKKIDGGWSENALEALTGKSFSQRGMNKGFLGLGSKTEADISGEILATLATGSPMTASTRSDGDIAKADKGENGFAAANSIVGNHEYAIMKADKNGITLRNPWGSGAANAEPTLTWAQFKKFYRGYTGQD